MMNQGVDAYSAATVDHYSVESRYIGAVQEQASSYPPAALGSETASWHLHGGDNTSLQNGNGLASGYQHDQQVQPIARNSQDGLNATLIDNTSALGTSSSQDHSYGSYTSTTDPYGYGSAEYANYYSGYQQQPGHPYTHQQTSHPYSQQQTNNSYSQPVGAYQNTGVAYQPLSSFENSGSYAGNTSYSTTYYNPGNYQTAGVYPSSGYSNQSTTWSDGNYANYASHHYPSYSSNTASAYNSGAINTTVNYQQHYKQWEDYYKQTEVSCAPGTEHLSVGTTSSQGSSVQSVGAGYPASNSQPPPSSASSWNASATSSSLVSVQPAPAANGSDDSYWSHWASSFQNQHATPTQPQLQISLDSKPSYNNFQEQNTASQGSNLQYAATHQVHQSSQPSMQSVPSLDTRRVGKLQIPTNPRIASNFAFGLSKVEKESSTAGTVAKPAYVSVSVPKADETVLSNDTADTVLKPNMFPKSLCGYVQRALARCNNDNTKLASCQAMLKEIITKATADGTLNTRDWDSEPLFPSSKTDTIEQSTDSSVSVSLFQNNKRSPSRRSKSRWEPLPEGKSVEKSVSAPNIVKYIGWDKKPISGNFEGKVEVPNFTLPEHRTQSKSSQRPVKRQRLAAGVNAVDNGDASSESDKEQSLTAYYSGALALANSPEEKKKRESRSKRFDKGHGHRSEINYYKPKAAGAGNLYTKRASALMLTKSFDDAGSRAVEDIDWDSLTVKGTCQEIEKRYLRLTSAPDPSTVRPEDVLERALHMVQNSERNYLYRCDQLKSIRQDLTVQHIRNRLTVKVYETHARLALQAGDLPEYNQCQSQLKTLYAEGIEGCHMEFAAYSLLCVILHSNNNRELLSSMSRLTEEAKNDETVKYALAVRAAVTSGNYVKFFKLYRTAPNLTTCLMDLCVDKMRYKAVNSMSRAYRPTVPVSYIALVLGFSNSSEEVDNISDGLEECVEWLKAHGACLITDPNGEVQFDAKASLSTLHVPEPEDAVAHGDANLAVNDFFARTSL